MPTTRHRKARGAETQRLVASYLTDNGFPYATASGAGESGVDILNVIGLGLEVKARREFRPAEWLRQADGHAAGVPFVVVRFDGQGPASIGSFGVIGRLSDMVRVWRAAGYGCPLVPD